MCFILFSEKLTGNTTFYIESLGNRGRGRPQSRRLLLLLLVATFLCKQLYDAQSERELYLNAISIYNDVSWHSEVVYSYMQFFQNFGADKINVFDASLRVCQFSKGIRRSTHAISNNNSLFKERFGSFCNTTTSAKFNLLVFVTPEICNRDIREIAETFLRKCPHPSIYWTCHNLRRCLLCLNGMKHGKYITVLSPTEKMASLTAMHHKRYLTLMPMLHFRGRTSSFSIPTQLKPSFQILIPGSVNFSKRAFKNLLFIGVHPSQVHINIFGKCIDVASCRTLRHLSHELALKGISIEHSGNFMLGLYSDFALLYEMLKRSRFIFPAIDDTVAFARRYSEDGKLTSSVSLAISFGRPMILWCELKKNYNFHKQLCYSKLSELSNVVNQALVLTNEEYNSMVNEMRQKRAELTNIAFKGMVYSLKHRN